MCDRDRPRLPLSLPLSFLLDRRNGAVHAASQVQDRQQTDETRPVTIRQSDGTVIGIVRRWDVELSSGRHSSVHIQADLVPRADHFVVSERDLILGGIVVQNESVQGRWAAGREPDYGAPTVLPQRITPVSTRYAGWTGGDLRAKRAAIVEDLRRQLERVRTFLVAMSRTGSELDEIDAVIKSRSASSARNVEKAELEAERQVEQNKAVR